ncbi:hypothetical protein DFJ58DRAFT_836127 [Suillus subalutaceus]|uniref:uncharacterized protein n=1 Tax=Suillus subalutaceus TaxID=48586 RepID=UPI001B86CC10|nr:uncharacterized protein DFJ58DRAFT_836127 [Suillus subalutaceus]KAG1875512.1 hypothetical protein DFJ58DRAFT_836127 [Suillus subalutaceus]
MSKIPTFTKRGSPTNQRVTFDLANMANIFKFATSRLLVIRCKLETSTLVTSPRDHRIVVKQLATIHAEIEQEGNEIWKMMENKVVEAKIVAASLMKMETALGQDVIAAITATDALIKYLRREPKTPMQPATNESE